AHHGGWLNGDSAGQDLGLRTLWSGAEREVAALCGAETSRLIAQALVYMDRRSALMRLLDLSTGHDALVDWWPLVAYLTRVLRLSDQQATAEGGKSE
ncbi:MAG: hypothetical protein ACYC7H_07385, partial [Chloroflexota bacterium]